MEVYNPEPQEKSRLTITLDNWHQLARQNTWMRLFAIFLRFALALGFIPAGMVKILGERFTDLHALHPMGHFLDAFYQTGFYYTFVGIMQVIAGTLLLIPRTTTLGAFIYFPIILNICVLSLSVRFDGSLLSSPLMVLANLYLLCWDYHKWKHILPLYKVRTGFPRIPSIRQIPLKFFTGVFAAMLLVLLMVLSFGIRPANTLKDCQERCENDENPLSCNEFCECVHLEGNALNACLDKYNASSSTSVHEKQ